MGLLGEDIIFGGISMLFDAKAPDLYNVTYTIDKKSMGIFRRPVQFWLLIFIPCLFIFFAIMSFLLEYIFVDLSTYVYVFFTKFIPAYYIDFIKDVYDFFKFK